MIFPICVGHTAKGIVRIARGEDARVMGCIHDYVLYVNDTWSAGMITFSIGSAGTGDEWRHCVEKGGCVQGRGWKHDFTFFAYEEQHPGTIPYAVGHAHCSDGWKFQLLENSTFAGNDQWKHEFVFFAFPLSPDHCFPISVGSNPLYGTARVVSGITAKDGRHKQKFTFNALEKPQPGTVCFAVGAIGSGEHARNSLIKGGDAGVNGWNHTMVFHAFENQRLGTIPIAVGHAQYSEGLKYRVSKNCTFAGGHGWTHDFVFYASLTDKSRLMPVSVWFEPTHFCARLKQYESLEESYFKHAFTFYGFNSCYPGTIPISIGEAGELFNRTLRSRVVMNSCYAGESGWKDVFSVYVFPDRKPGTIPIAVGHADFALGGGGWKYRVEQHCENAGTDGWEHDFVFYAYPQPQ